MGHSICALVKDVFSGGFDLRDFNKTVLVLIPKIEKPEFISQFRPISLCNVIYKCVSKVVVNKIKPFLPNLVSPFQTSFVPGQHIQDNVVVAKELFHIMKMKGKKGFFAMKIDLEKAYDRMGWDFLDNVLKEVSVLDDFRKVVVDYFSAVSTQLIWSGTLLERFCPSRRLRHRDPNSPYLFVLGMGKLSHIITSTVQNNQWKAIKVGRNGPEVSHLMFADDLIFFSGRPLLNKRLS